MQLIHAAAASALFFSGMAAAQSTITANTPSSLFECQPVLLSWSGGVPPYIPKINQAGSTSDTIEELPTTSDTSFTWTVNQPAGIKITFAVTDSTGATGFSGESPSIGSGTTSCLSSSSSSASGSSSSSSGASSSTSGSSSSSSAPASSSSSAAAASTSSSAPSSSAAKSSAASSSAPSSTSSSSSKPDSASTVRGFAAVGAGVVGVAVAALL